MTTSQLSVAFFLQMCVILTACRVVGWLAKRCGQPQAVGEMIAGVLLGPSLFGLVWPTAQSFIFPPETLKVLYVGAQLGIGLYMFLVGAEFDAGHFRSRFRSAAAVSLAGMIVPFAFGAGLAWWLWEQSHLFGPKATSLDAALFLGAAIAITAFPVLARIIHDRGLTSTALGTLALSAGAIDDAAAWCVLAVVLARLGVNANGGYLAIGGGALYAVIMLFIAPRLLAPLGRHVERQGSMSQPVLGGLLALLMLCSWATDAIGIHAVFGGFLLGIAMPRGVVTRELRQKVEPFVVVFLLPMFFTYSGLNTQLHMINDSGLLLTGALVLAVSIVGKGVACYAAARLCGENNATSLAVGALMNARGLMELIIINIGLQHGIIGPPLFSMLVVMAIVTTLMATPIFEAVYARQARARGDFGNTRSP